MVQQDKKQIQLYTFLCSLLSVIFISSNLICKKYISLSLGNVNFQVSVGLLFFPITFLLTDIITEFFGKQKAIFAVKLCLLNGLAILVLVKISSMLPATTWSQVTNKDFDSVFNIYDISIAASFISFYVCQYVDIRLFSFIKEQTKGKHLWLRNNISSMTSQAIDTLLVISILVFFKVIPASESLAVAISSYTFKFIAAILDTPFCYLAHYQISRKWLNNSAKS